MAAHFTSVAEIVAGLGLLVAGGVLLVRGASRLAAIARVPPLIVGLTVVALGTSAPEMAVTIESSVRGHADLAIGNVVGSNILNVLAILGLSALATPLVVSARLIWWDVPLMIGISILPLLLGLDGSMGRADGAVLVVLFIAYLVWSAALARRESRAVREQYEHEYAFAASGGKAALVELLWVVVGLAVLTLGAHWMVEGSSAIARALGIGELVIGLTVLAVGTSLPEASASIIAAWRGERDIAAGNIVGSNILNILAVLGISAVVAAEPIRVSPVALEFHIPVMIAVSVACLPVVFTGHLISRWEGALFVFYYGAYLEYSILRVTAAEKAVLFKWAMLWFVIPLTVLTLLIGVARAVRGRAEREPAPADSHSSTTR